MSDDINSVAILVRREIEALLAVPLIEGFIEEFGRDNGETRRSLNIRRGNQIGLEQNKNGDVQGNEADCNKLESDFCQGIIVVERNKHLMMPFGELFSN